MPNASIFRVLFYGLFRSRAGWPNSRQYDLIGQHGDSIKRKFKPAIDGDQADINQNKPVPSQARVEPEAHI